ncbi:hypothetical protein XM38_032570 [Halomicronema hongdechloris C2206]|uniref:UPF0102 protein XM38_032570 n=1 Tax=Halomicronema hongdechloris C2206 TaxID=1641165 RepID=A0A1Z3HPR4_9CYAN|nr:YraN family protein [Halomicronema hongdechloris]ASC72301.1 hypothetical protein XM38_032570 [Halomicronema hongdechloris C2206]
MTIPLPQRADLGRLGELLVADWLRHRGGELVAQRWHCRWGELDLVVRQPDSLLAFVEVKTRRQGNWDADGLMAITPQKQRKLWRAAQLFLIQQPQWQEWPCRFDVALVTCQTNPQIGLHHRPLPQSLYSLVLQDYLEDAFSLG